MKRVVGIGAVVIGLVFSSCGGDDRDATTSPSPAPAVEAPGGGTSLPSAPAGLPPEVVECFADQGIDDAEIHSAPPQVLQACFGAAH